MSNPQTTESPQVKLMREVGRALAKRDLGPFAKHTHKDCRRVHYPRSLGRPDQTGEEWIQSWADIFSLWTGDGEVIMHSIFEASGKVIIHANIKAGTSIGVDFDRELFLTITIVTDEDGIMKMKHVDGFADSKMELEFAKAVAEANANRQHVA